MSAETGKEGAKRSVVSYVRRSGKLTDRLRRAWDEYSPRYLLDLQQEPGSLNLHDGFIFDRDLALSLIHI